MMPKTTSFKDFINFYLFIYLKVVSPSLRYLMAVQNHLLSNTILIRPDESDDSDNSLQGETMKVQVNIPFNYPYLCAVCVSVRETQQTKMQ